MAKGVKKCEAARIDKVKKMTVLCQKPKGHDGNHECAGWQWDKNNNVVAFPESERCHKLDIDGERCTHREGHVFPHSFAAKEAEPFRYPQRCQAENASGVQCIRTEGHPVRELLGDGHLFPVGGEKKSHSETQQRSKQYTAGLLKDASDLEVAKLGTIIECLESLDAEQRERVLRYLDSRYGAKYRTTVWTR